jgi:hypothetical protein
VKPRHVSISDDPVVAAQQNAENARDISEALSRVLDAYTYTVEPYIATGSITTTIPLRSEAKPPKGVLPLRVVDIDETGVAVEMASIVADFVHDAARGALYAFEPEGLTAGNRYSLTFLIVR